MPSPSSILPIPNFPISDLICFASNLHLIKQLLQCFARRPIKQKARVSAAICSVTIKYTVTLQKWLKAQSATQPFLVSSRNAPPHWGRALRDDTKNGCVADYSIACVACVSSRVRQESWDESKKITRNNNSIGNACYAANYSKP